MKPSFQHLGFNVVQESFLCFQVSSPKFGFHWHYHPECEISYVLNGYGTRLVGDNVQNFEKGDLLFLGSDLPHTLISDELFNQSNQLMEVIVIQFPLELLKPRVEEIHELSNIGLLINNSNRGLSFAGEEVEKVGLKMQELIDCKGFNRYHLLLEILNDLSNMPFEHLASKLYSPRIGNNSEERIRRVCTYIHENFSSHIDISKLASLSFMNEAAFCRFFKRMTGKTAMTYINDLRISKSCQLMLSEGLSISEAAYQSGFNSITHFNRSFIKRKGETPSSFRKHFSSVG